MGGREGGSLTEGLPQVQACHEICPQFYASPHWREGALGPPGPVTKTKPPLLGDLAPVHLTCLIAHKLLLAPAIHFRRATNTLIVISSICFFSTVRCSYNRYIQRSNPIPSLPTIPTTYSFECSIPSNGDLKHSKM